MIAAARAAWQRSANPERAMAEITELIGKARGGDREASERVFALLYDELRRVAAGQLRGEQAMRTTSLVHEAYLKLAQHGAVEVNDRGHFFAVAARVMRQVVIDHVRSRAALRRGGNLQIASLDTTALQAAAEDRGDEVLALDSALDRLADIDAPLAALVEMRFYAGLELAEIASVQDRSERSLKRDWRRARAFLQREIAGP
jgi:RNA polymerase sigma factor (TIGR02999 family)